MGRHRRSKEVGKLLDRTLELISGFGQNLVDDGGNSVAHGDGKCVICRYGYNSFVDCEFRL